LMLASMHGRGPTLAAPVEHHTTRFIIMDWWFEPFWLASAPMIHVGRCTHTADRSQQTNYACCLFKKKGLTC
jgi:hypothetical protein